jgi:uncharacterized protein (DUF427 family)
MTDISPSIDSIGPSPGAQNHPNHLIDIQKSNQRWIVLHEGQVLAESVCARLLQESNYPSVVYFPPGDVQTDLLSLGDTHTYCPFKGEAHYYSYDVGPEGSDGESRDIAWFYPRVYDEVADIAGYIAFYANRVTIVQAE